MKNLDGRENGLIIIPAKIFLKDSGQRCGRLFSAFINAKTVVAVRLILDFD